MASFFNCNLSCNTITSAQTPPKKKPLVHASSSNQSRYTLTTSSMSNSNPQRVSLVVTSPATLSPVCEFHQKTFGACIFLSHRLSPRPVQAWFSYLSSLQVFFPLEDYNIILWWFRAYPLYLRAPPRRLWSWLQTCRPLYPLSLFLWNLWLRPPWHDSFKVNLHTLLLAVVVNNASWTSVAQPVLPDSPCAVFLCFWPESPSIL